jgi:hypothetical protein
MTTITLKINDNSVAGKSFLAFLKNFVIGKKGVEVVPVAKEKNRYNAETEKAIADVRAGKGLTSVKNSEELFKQLGI